jgi:hypothetical protein
MAESDRVSLAGTIGTWAAVFVALVALIAVIGPVLIWAASRTERNKALHDARDAKQPFIGSGIHFVGFDVRLFRRIQAPIIDKMPEKPILLWDVARFTETKSRATWVQFASLLLAYGAMFERGNNLIIYRGKAILPVYRVWILVIGLIGRYSTKESRPLRKKSERSLSVKFQTPTQEFQMPTQEFKMPKQDSPQDDTIESVTWPIRVDLIGTTGQIQITEKVLGLGLTESTIAIFLPRPISEIVGMKAEKLSLQDLLMLAVGCLKLPSRQYIALIDLWSPEELEFDHHPMDMELVRPLMDVHQPTMLINRIVPREATRKETAIRRSMSHSNTTVHEVKEPVALRLEKIANRDDELERLRSAFGQMKQEVLAFVPQELDGGLLAELRMYMNVAFVNPLFNWIRLPKADSAATQQSNIFFWRADAQKVAHGLFNLPWHPQGYLIGGSSSAYCIRLLEVAGCEFLYLLTRVRENVESLNIEHEEKKRFKGTLAAVDNLVRREQKGTSLPSHTEFYTLDEMLSSFGHSDPKINDMIGVLMMTNQEFASFVRQSARHFDKSIAGSFDVALMGHVRVKLPFGGTQEYPVDMKDIYADWQPRDEIVPVNYTVATLACLRASMRSYLLNIRFDGYPLMQGVLGMDDIVYIA